MMFCRCRYSDDRLCAIENDFVAKVYFGKIKNAKLFSLLFFRHIPEITLLKRAGYIIEIIYDILLLLILLIRIINRLWTILDLT